MQDDFLKLASYLYIFAKKSNFYFWFLVDDGPLVYITILGSDNDISFASIWMVEKKTMKGIIITKYLSLKMHFAKASYRRMNGLREQSSSRVPLSHAVITLGQ